MNKLYLILIINLIFLSSLSSAQSNNDTLFIAFWNLESLFDTIDDTEKNDEQFLPDGDNEWTNDRLDIKLNHLARVIRSMNNSNGPDLLGVCEVEHQSMLDSLIARYLDDINYKIAYVESPDKRGIDNGLIYNSNIFELILVKGDTVHLKDNWPTRPIVNVKLIYKSVDTLSVYINHWPSRSRGREMSEPNRIAAASTLRISVDEDFNLNPSAKIIVFGDFNDEPTNLAILETLDANTFKCDSIKAEYLLNTKGELFNTSFTAYEDGLGTYKYRDDWNMLDQIIISGDLITNPDFYYICNSFNIYKPYFMVTQSGNYIGTASPTYGGKEYLGGYSDHFPVTAKFLINRNN
ncbi:MAG: endonuclease/exonuclease/phosphatase family protein [Ignavibacteriaceae bacterium]